MPLIYACHRVVSLNPSALLGLELARLRILPGVNYPSIDIADPCVLLSFQIVKCLFRYLPWWRMPGFDSPDGN
jgi:hypothetical protein